MEIRTLGASGLEMRKREFSQLKMIFCILFWLLVIWVSTFALLTKPLTL